MPQSIRYAQENATAVITLSGRVVAEDNASLMEHLEKMIKSDAAIKAIDLTEIEYIDSYALGQIIYYCNSMTGPRSNVYMVNRKGCSTPFIDRLIDLHAQRDAEYYGVFVWVLAMLEQWLHEHKVSL